MNEMEEQKIMCPMTTPSLASYSLCVSLVVLPPDRSGQLRVSSIGYPDRRFWGIHTLLCGQAHARNRRVRVAAERILFNYYYHAPSRFLFFSVCVCLCNFRFNQEVCLGCYLTQAVMRNPGREGGGRGWGGLSYHDRVQAQA